MNHTALKYYALVVLSVALFVVLCGCSNLGGSSPDLGGWSPAGTGGNPYMVDVTLSSASCPSWQFIIVESPDGKWCATTVPTTLHTGDEVKLFAGGITGQLFSVSAVDRTHHSVTLAQIG